MKDDPMHVGRPAGAATVPEPAVEDEGPISEEQARKIAEEYESEAQTRQLGGFWRWVVGVLAAGLAIYALYWTQVSITTQVYRASFLAVALALTFLLYPIRTRRDWIELSVIAAVGVLLVVFYWLV